MARYGVKRVLFLLTFVWFAPACAYLRSAETPMAVVRFTKLGARSARGALVLLPGFGDRPETFVERGFVAALRRRAPAYDVIAADAHFGYYRKRLLLPRLHQDVIAPLRAEGYREIWLVGTSMGGFGSVAYARAYPQSIRGLLLFAPYMGPSGIVAEVERVGLCAYKPKLAATPEDGDSFARANFDYLRRTTCEDSSVAVWLAVGEEDGLLKANRTLGAVLPKERFLVLPGGHGWKVWTPAVERLVPSALVEARGQQDE
jgi:pimeloyl-ACP methyl ester carboxylesterase